MSIVIKIAAEEVKVEPSNVGPFKVSVTTEPEQLGLVLERLTNENLQLILEQVGSTRVCRVMNLIDNQ
jgi:hypothetical protein